METANLVLKLRLKSDICCMVSEDVGAADRRGSGCAIRQEYVPHIRIILEHYLTCCTDYSLAEADSLEEYFKNILELSDNMPDKADRLYNCGVGLHRSFINTERKGDTFFVALVELSGKHTLIRFGDALQILFLDDLYSIYEVAI